MGNSVEGQKCPGCGAYIFDNDDLVYCPECGAPHHRECYAALGHCALEDKHGTPLQYKKPEKNENDKNLEHENVEEQQKKVYGPTIEGSQQYQSGVFPTFGTTIRIDPLGAVSPDDMIGDATAKDVGDFVAVNTPRYVPRFKAMNNKKKKSWNWGAFFFPQAWFFYRKMYLPGTFFFILTVAISLLSFPYINLMNTLPLEAQRSYSTFASYVIQNAATLNLTPLYISIGGVVLECILRVAAGIFGDRIYRSSVLEGVKDVKSQEQDDDIPLNMALHRKGGVNMIMGMFGILAAQWATTLLYTLI